MRRIFSIFAAIAVVASVAANTRSPKNEVARNLDIFNALYKALQTSYVDSIDATKSINTAIAYMLNDIDPYTEYYPEDDQDEFMSISTGEYGGIGSYITQPLKSDRITPKGPTRVSAPREGSPAARAGLRPGDIFLTIDGDTVTSMLSSKISEKLKGQPGTTVHITVKRPYVADSILTFDIVREKININPVPYYGMLSDGKTGYINLETFNEKSAQEVREAVIDLKKQGATALVLDLRGNGGGILEGAVQIAGLFLPKGTEVVKTQGRGLVNDKTYKTTERPIDTEIPLAVLTDASTASSSEILSGALQDLDRAVVIGQRSFGKGLVQSSRQLPYNGLLKVTIARYYTPSGRCVQAIDYSHRNPDGSVSRVPDSLTNVFHTAAGREVRDGGGITPDIKIDPVKLNNFTGNLLITENAPFEFATYYRNNNEKVLPPSEWEVTDEIYDQFKNFVNPDSLNKDRICEVLITELEKASETEGYLSDEVKATIATLRDQIKPDINHDFDINRDVIATELAREIMARYYYDSGRIEQSLRYDKEIAKAMEVLSDPAQYKALLAPPAP